jgi:hypothetical protein
MATHGESYDQTLPTVVLSWAGSGFGSSGSFSITGTDTPWNPDTFKFVTSGGTINVDGADLAPVSQTTSLTKVDHARVVKGEASIPVAYGAVTLTITPAANTEVHFSVGVKNPTAKAQTLVGAPTDAHGVALTQIYKCNVGYIYSTPVIFDPPIAPGISSSSTNGHFRGKNNGYNEIRIRAYQLVTVNGKQEVSPNDKSELLIVRFYQHR